MHYLLRLEKDCKEGPARSGGANEQPEPAGIRDHPSIPDRTRELAERLREVESLAEEKTRMVTDLGNQLANRVEAVMTLEARLEEREKGTVDLEGQLEEVGKKLEMAVGLAEERAVELDDRRRAFEERVRTLEVEAEGAQDWARSSEGELTKIRSILENRDVECRRLHETLDEKRSESEKLRQALQIAETNLESQLSEAGRQAIKSFRTTPEYLDDLTQASTDAFSFGFEECLERVSRMYPDINFGDITLEDLISSPRVTRLATPPTPGVGMEVNVDEVLSMNDLPLTPQTVNPATPSTPGKGIEAITDDAPPSSGLGRA